MSHIEPNIEEISALINNQTPTWAYLTLFIMLSIAMLGAYGLCKDRKDMGRWMIASLLVVYILLVLCVTVFFRPQLPHPNLHWRFFPDGIYAGRLQITEALLNIILLIPFGWLSAALFHKHAIIRTTLCGFLFSLFIESLQMYFQCGFSDWADLLHNTLGAFIGATCIWMLRHYRDSK